MQHLATVTGDQRNHAGLNAIDILPRARSKTKVMQPGTILIERRGAMFLTRRANADARSAADAIEQHIGAHQALHVEKRQQFLVERQTAGIVLHREVDMCDAIQTHFFIHWPALERKINVPRVAARHVSTPRQSAQNPA